ncbi:MAG TPA: serine/threonine-protein kinase [Pyrinomonadaceae bacterium]|nr:serine/threonine-protein kinase [Pyrinomonadaceae bacterium]
MSSENWQQVKLILDEALGRSPQTRGCYLDNACRSDTGLRREIEFLLAFDSEDADFIGDSAFDLAGWSSSFEQSETFIGKQIGHYKITKELGAGGMGNVYLAIRDDGEFEQKVAVKLIRRGFDRETILRKFRLERQILARLNHQNIARLHDGGTSKEGFPYLFMEYVEGVSIDEYCRENNCSLEERLELFCKVVGAVSYAHQRLVVHRDLKPSNVLVTKDGVPKLLDFGIAKLLEIETAENSTVTENRQLTPQYASPEQIRGEAIGTASDVYSLGVILYELLTGQFPYRIKTANPLELARAISEQEPVKPSSAGTGKQDEEIRRQGDREKNFDAFAISPSPFLLVSSSQLKGDLDNIILKALEKDVSRRYASAEQLSEDIRRYLEGLPIKARQNNWRYRSGKFVRRNRLAVSAAALILLVLLGGIVATSYQTLAANRERALAEKRFNDVRRLSNSFLFEFHDAIENLSGATKARQLVVSRALEYLNNLSRESAADPTLQAEIAEAYRRLGEIQGHPSFPNLGDTGGAIESFGKAKSLCEELVRSDPNNSEYLFKLAAYDSMLGDMMERAVYNTPAAQKHYRSALDIRRRLSAEDPTNPKYLNALTLSYERLGNVQMKTGDITGAYATYEEALKISGQLLAGDPENRKFRRGLCLSYYDFANLLLADGKYEEALENYEKGRRLAERRRLEDAADADAQRLLGIFDDLMSKAYSALDNSPKAFEHASR